MNIKYPHKNENCIGETLIFKELLKEQGGDRLLVENYAVPGKGHCKRGRRNSDIPPAQCPDHQR